MTHVRCTSYLYTKKLVFEGSRNGNWWIDWKWSSMITKGVRNYPSTLSSKLKLKLLTNTRRLKTGDDLYNTVVTVHPSTIWPLVQLRLRICLRVCLRGRCHVTQVHPAYYVSGEGGKRRREEGKGWRNSYFHGYKCYMRMDWVQCPGLLSVLMGTYHIRGYKWHRVRPSVRLNLLSSSEEWHD